jgi:hypothetical protein
VIDALLGGDHVVTVEISAALLELSEVLDALQRALRPEESLDVDASERRGVDPIMALSTYHDAKRLQTSI